MRCEMSYFDSHGVRLYYEEEGAGDPVLLIPGWGGSIAEFAAIRSQLAKQYRVIAVDPPGSGKSGPQPRTYTPGYYREDVPHFVALLQALDATPAHLVGFSDGGEYELLIAALHPSCARSLVVWGAAGSLGSSPEIADLMSSVIDNPIPPTAGFAEYMKATYGEQNARIMTRSAGSAFRKIIEGGGDLSRTLADKILCPATLITGEGDFVATPALVSDMARAIPNGEFVEVKGAAHPVHLEQGDHLIEIITSRLAR
jgi:valacyclovir hydrolase